MILSNFLKTRIVSYRIFFKNLEKKKQRIKLPNLFQIETNTTEYDFFIFLRKKVSGIFFRRKVLVYYVYYRDTIRRDLTL